MRYRIFCYTRPRTGSRESHTCVANYTNHSRNICGKFKNRPGRESFRFQRRAEIKHSTLARTRFKHAFSTQNSGRVTTGISKTRESELRNLVNLGCFWQCNFFGMYINCCYFCVSDQRTSRLFLSFLLIVPRWRLGRPIKTIDNSWRDEKMRASETECGREVSEDVGSSLYFPSYARVRTCENMFVFFESLRFYGEQESV